ncbi:MAG: DUF2892 domain-containing protein [Candidatus Magasanikbacteria bacterium]|nr:DUF2892 domain-containing protein [Candidatus Magasanikbacteria bacterium]
MFKFERNEGTLDRVIRFIVALNLLGWAYFGFTGASAVICYILGGIALFTSLTGFCIIYPIFGINTIKK